MTKAWPLYATLVALIALAFFLAVIYGYRWGFWDLSPVFTWLRRAPLVLAPTALLALVAGGRLLVRKSVLGGMIAVTIAVLSAGLAYVPLWMRAEAAKVPPIHDITTDVQDPPAFVAVLPLRADAPNPPGYDREQTTQQLEAFPDIVSLMIADPVEDAFSIALDAVKAEGMKVVAAVPEAGRIEAYATAPLFGFRDDVVVRLRPSDEGGTRIDVRSKSRVGRSDLGFNARRVRSLLARIEKASA